MTLEHLSLRRLTEIYYRYLFWDFPPMERRPLWKIRRLRALGRYDAWAMLDDRGRTAAYAAAAKNGSDILLDYLAVCRGRRGRGLGTGMLALLAEEFSGQTVFVEAEDPASAPDDQARAERKRRIRFYLRSGFCDSGIRCTVYGVPYVILCSRTLPPEEAKSRLDGLYRAVFTGKAYREHVSFQLPVIAGG